MSKSGRLDYISAVKCLQSRPAQTADIHAGARSRYDDFQALHIDQTDYIHFCVGKGKGDADGVAWGRGG